jgi:hypothetical protein
MKTNNKCPSCKSPNYIVSVFGSICQICYYDSSKETLSPQPEEWQKAFLDAGTYETGTDLSCMIGIVSKILETEIRKAEERMLQRLYVGDIKEAEFEALKNGTGAVHFMFGFRYARNNLQKQKSDILEALKK